MRISKFFQRIIASIQSMVFAIQTIFLISVPTSSAWADYIRIEKLSLYDPKADMAASLYGESRYKESRKNNDYATESYLRNYYIEQQESLRNKTPLTVSQIGDQANEETKRDLATRQLIQDGKWTNPVVDSINSGLSLLPGLGDMLKTKSVDPETIKTITKGITSGNKMNETEGWVKDVLGGSVTGEQLYQYDRSRSRQKIIGADISSQRLFEEAYKFVHDQPSLFVANSPSDTVELKKILRMHLDLNRGNSVELKASPDEVVHSVRNSIDAKIDMLLMKNPKLDEKTKRLLVEIKSELKADMKDLKDGQNRIAEKLNEMPQLIGKIVSQEMQKNIRDYSLDTDEQNLPPEKLKQRWENRATIYEANVTTIGAFRDVMQLALIVSGRNEDAAKVHAMFSTMMNLMSSYQHSAALMGKAAMETGAAQEALQQAAAGALVSGWVGVAIVVAGLLMSPKNDGDQQAKYLARQFEELHKSIGQLHTSMLKQFSQLHYRLDQFEGNVYQSLNQINEFIQSLGQVAIQTSQKIDYANEVLAQIHRNTEEVRWDLVEALITNQKKTLGDIAREIGGRGDLNGTLKQILSRLEISANLVSQFNGNSISGGKAPNGGRALRLLDTPEFSPANLLAPLSAQVLRDPSMNARRMVHLKEWSDLVALSSKLLAKQKNFDPELLTELSQTLTAQAQDLNELRAGLHARRFDILNGILNQIDFNHANLKIYIQSLWEKAVLETAEELKMKGSYDRPQVVMDMQLCDLQDDMAPRQNSEQLKKFIVDGLTQNDRARIFFTPRSKILGPRKFDPGIPDTESATVRACLQAGPSKTQVLAGGQFWSGADAAEAAAAAADRVIVQGNMMFGGVRTVAPVLKRYFGIRGGACSVVYPVSLKVQLAHTNALTVKDFQISSQYFYNYIKDTVPVEAQSLPYAQKFADLEFKVEDPKIKIQIAEFGQDNWQRWENRRIRAHQQGLSEIACRNKWVAASRDISREQAFVAAILAPPTDYHSGDNNSLLVRALLDKNLQEKRVETVVDKNLRADDLKAFFEKNLPSSLFTNLMEVAPIGPDNVPWAGMKTEPSAMQVSEYKISDQPKNQPQTGAPSPAPSLQRKENINTFFKDFIPMPKDEATVKNNPFHSEYSNYLLNKDLSSFGASEMSADLNTPDPHIVQAFYAKATNRFLRNLIRLIQDDDDPTDENRRIPVSVRNLLVQNELLAKMVPVFMNFVYGNDPRVFENLSNMTHGKIATTDTLLFLAYSVLHKGIWKVDLKKVNLLKPVDLAQKLTYETYLAREFMNDTTSAPLLIDLATSEGLNRLRAESVEILSMVGEKLPAASFQNQLDQTLNLIKKRTEYNSKGYFGKAIESVVGQ